MIKNQDILLKSFVRHKSGVFLSDMDGEKVMLSIENGKYYNLGVVGGDIWELLDHSIKVSDLITKLMKEYDVAKEDCQEQVIHFLEMLLKEELIEITRDDDYYQAEE